MRVRLEEGAALAVGCTKLEYHFEDASIMKRGRRWVTCARRLELVPTTHEVRAGFSRVGASFLHTKQRAFRGSVSTGLAGTVAQDQEEPTRGGKHASTLNGVLDYMRLTTRHLVLPCWRMCRPCFDSRRWYFQFGAVRPCIEKRRVRLIRVAARGPELRIASATPALVAASCQAKAAA